MKFKIDTHTNRMKRILIAIFALIISGSLYAQEDSCLVVRILSEELSDTSGLTEFYNPRGMYLLQNGIYNFKVNGKSYNHHRIVSINGDSIQIAWAMDTEPLIKFHVNEIDKLVFPSLDNGVSGFPHPTLTRKKYNFQVVSHKPYKLTLAKICEDDDCQKYFEAYLFMTSGYGWKPIYKQNGETYMLDKSVIHNLKKK